MRGSLVFVLTLAGALVAAAATNEPARTSVDGHELARRLVESSPTENSSLTGVLYVRLHRQTTEIPVTVRTVVDGTGWKVIYETTPGTNGSAPATLTVVHDGTNANRYELNGKAIAPADTAVPFAGTDFWLSDLGLEFLHWPEQRIINREFRRNCACEVLESTNPSPQPGNYSRVVSWIDEQSGGIVLAMAYDGANRLKYFEPKDFQKVNGQWQLQGMQIENERTDSRTRLVFNPGPK